MKYLLGLAVFLSSPVQADTQADRDYDLHRLSQATQGLYIQSIINSVPDEPHYVVVNQAGPGCHWAELVTKNDRPKIMVGSDNKYHAVYLKVCADDLDASDGK